MGILPKKTLAGTSTEGVVRELQKKKEFLSEMSQSSSGQATEDASGKKNASSIKTFTKTRVRGKM